MKLKHMIVGTIGTALLGISGAALSQTTPQQTLPGAPIQTTPVPPSEPATMPTPTPDATPASAPAPDATPTPDTTSPATDTPKPGKKKKGKAPKPPVTTPQ